MKCHEERESLFIKALRGSRTVSGKVISRSRREFLDSRIWELGTITGRGFLDRRIWEQGSIKKQVEVNIRTQGEVGGLGCAIRGDVEAHQKIKKSNSRRSQHQEEEDKVSGRTEGKKK